MKKYFLFPIILFLISCSPKETDTNDKSPLITESKSPTTKQIVSNTKQEVISAKNKVSASGIVDNNSAFNDLIKKINSVKYSERSFKLPALCFQAANLATNLQQRYLALIRLAWLYCANGDAENAKIIINKILADETPPYKVWRKIFWLQRDNSDVSGATNLIARMVNSETNADLIISMSLYGATITKEIDEKAINELVKKFPSNGNMYVKIADIFKKHEWYDNEIKYRKLAVKFLSDNNKKIAQINILIERYLKFNEIGSAEKLLSEYTNILSNNANFTIGMSKIYIASGRTNDAFDLLISNCKNSTPDKEIIIKKLLTFNWPEKGQHIKAATIAQNFIDSLSKEQKKQLSNNVYQLLIKKYIFTGQSEKAFDLCKDIFSSGKNTKLLPIVCRLIDNSSKIQKLIEKIIASGATQAQFYAVAAQVCDEASLSELACELYYKACQGNGKRFGLNTALRLAVEAKNYDLCEEIIDKIIKKFKKGQLRYFEIRRILKIIKNENIKGKDKLELLLSKTKEGKRLNAINGIFNEYKENKNITEICDLIKNCLENGEIDIDTVLGLSGKYYQIHDGCGMKAILELVEKQMTNSQVVAENGTFLLCQLAMLNEKNKCLDLAEKWFDDPNISLFTKDNILGNFQWIGADKRLIKIAKKLYANAPAGNAKKYLLYRLKDLYAKAGDVENFRKICDNFINDPIVDISYIAYQYEKMNLNDDALLLYDRELEKLSEDDPRRFKILKSQAKLFIKLGDANSALLCAKQILEGEPENAETHSFLADVYKSAGQYKTAADELCKSIKLSGHGFEQQWSYTKLIDLIQTADVRFDVSSFANSLLEESRSKKNLLLAAGLYAADNKINNSENLFQEAIAQAESNSQKEKLYEQWFETVRKIGDEKLIGKTLRDYYKVASDKNKKILEVRIVKFEVKARNYDIAIKDGKKFLEKMKNDKRFSWQVASIKNNMAHAYLESGDSENAWKMLNDSVKYSLSNYDSNPDWNDYVKIANQIGKQKEALEFVETAYNSCTPQKSNIRHLLLDLYKKTGRDNDIQKLVEEADEQLKLSAYYDKIDIADFYIEAGENEKALNVLKNVYNDSRTKEMNEHFRKIYDIYKKENRIDEALEWVDQQTECAELNGLKAEILAESGDYDKAIELYDKVSNDKNLLNYRKEFYKKKLVETAVKSGNKEKIVDKLVRKIKKKNPGNPQNEFKQSAEIYQLAEMYDDALRNIKRAESITKNKNEIEKLDNRKAECLAKKGEYADAVKVYKKILQDDSMKWEDRLSYQNKIMKTYKDAHRSDEVKDTAEDIVKTCKQFLREHKYGNKAMNARFTLADAYKNSGDKEEARNVLEKIQKKYKNTSYAKKAEEKLKEF